MCREEAQAVYSRIADLVKAGAARVVALVKEDVGNEVSEFRRYWPGEILLDGDQKFYMALGGGKHHKPYSSLPSLLMTMANPFSTRRVKTNFTRTKSKNVDNNFIGEGLVSGGCYVIRPDGSAAYSFREEDLGDHAPINDVIAAVSAASEAWLQRQALERKVQEKLELMKNQNGSFQCCFGLCKDGKDCECGDQKDESAPASLWSRYEHAGASVQSSLLDSLQKAACRICCLR